MDACRGWHTCTPLLGRCGEGDSSALGERQSPCVLMMRGATFCRNGTFQTLRSYAIMIISILQTAKEQPEASGRTGEKLLPP